MADEVLAFKAQMLEECEFESTADYSHTVSERNVAFYRYGGFALHSMIQKRQHHVQKEDVKSDLGLFETLKVTKEQLMGPNSTSNSTTYKGRVSCTVSYFVATPPNDRGKNLFFGE